jgi:hypothetical protein
MYLNTIISNIRSASKLKELVLKMSLKKTNSSSTYAIIGAMATITLDVTLIPDIGKVYLIQHYEIKLSMPISCK